MAKTTAPLLPVVLRRLAAVGENLRLARKRRRLTAKQVAERAGMTAVTLRQVERGAPGVTMGAYLAVMQVLGLDEDIELLAQEDPLGRRLQDAALLAKSAKSVGRGPRSRRGGGAADTPPGATTPSRSTPGDDR